MVYCVIICEVTVKLTHNKRATHCTGIHTQIRKGNVTELGLFEKVKTFFLDLVIQN